jgi:hypothetical protein
MMDVFFIYTALIRTVDRQNIQYNGPLTLASIPKSTWFIYKICNTPDWQAKTTVLTRRKEKSKFNYVGGGELERKEGVIINCKIS